MRISAGERFACVGPAGGGYGDPLQREPEAVLSDVLERWVTPEAAGAVYGVVLAPDGEEALGFALDRAATEQRRAELREARSAGGGA
jgi:N-methylhydantoinase B